MDDYLEQILHLIEEKGYARPVDISQRLGISQASVTNMLQRLDSEGLVKHEKYRGTVLTPQGEQIAKAIIDRHEVLTKFLRIFSCSASFPWALEGSLISGAKDRLFIPQVKLLIKVFDFLCCSLPRIHEIDRESFRDQLLGEHELERAIYGPF